MEKVKIAVIGNGIIGESHISGHVNNPNVELAALCDINETRLNEMGDRYGVSRRYTHIGKMLADGGFDAVDVCLHNNMHAPVSIAVMEAGYNCYCEKPMAGSYADALAMYNASLRTGKKLHIQLAMLYGDETKAAKTLIDSGKLGHIYHMRSYGFRRRGRPFVDGYATKEFVNTKTSGGGALFDMGVYHISQLLYLTGLPKLERVTGHIYAELAMAEKRRAESGFNVEELGTGYATFEGGLTMDILESWAIHAAEFPGSMIAGSDGGVCLSPFAFYNSIDDMETKITFDLGHMNYMNHTVYPENSYADDSQSHWINHLMGRCDLYPTKEIALLTQQIQEGIYLSMALGREVTGDEVAAMSKSKALEIPNL